MLFENPSRSMIYHLQWRSVFCVGFKISLPLEADWYWVTLSVQVSWCNGSACVGMSSSYIFVERQTLELTGISGDNLRLHVNLLLPHLFWGLLCFIKQIILHQCSALNRVTAFYHLWIQIRDRVKALCTHNWRVWKVCSPFPGCPLSFLRMHTLGQDCSSLHHLHHSPWWLVLFFLTAFMCLWISYSV